jgi:hypothetical protein
VALEEQLLTASLTETFQEADQILIQLYRNAPTTSEEADAPPDEYLEQQELLEHYVEKAFRDVGILAERFGLPLLTSQIAKARETLKSLSDVKPDLEVPIMFSAPLHVARNYFSSLRVMTEGREITGLGVFENVLQSAGRIMQSRKLVPTSETEVTTELRNVLSFAFPGQVRVPTIEKTLKSYKPDIGVVTLMAASETKFCVTENEAKNAMDGIYADMKGYSGRDEWRSFYAVIYMTEAFFSQADVDREFRLVKAEYNWTPFVVLGPGERKKRDAA